jgi:hypothetical protein
MPEMARQTWVVAVAPELATTMSVLLWAAHLVHAPVRLHAEQEPTFSVAQQLLPRHFKLAHCELDPQVWPWDSAQAAPSLTTSYPEVQLLHRPEDGAHAEHWAAAMVLFAQHTRPRHLPVRHWLSAEHAEPALNRHCPADGDNVFPGEQVSQVPVDEHTSHPKEDSALQHLDLQLCVEQTEEVLQADPGPRKHRWFDKKYGEAHATHCPLVPHELHPGGPPEEQQRPPKQEPEAQSLLASQPWPATRLQA